MTLHADGEEHPLSPQVPGIMVVARWLGTHELETIGKRGAETLGRGTYEVSSDGRAAVLDALRPWPLYIP